jgi:hypothetical protein
MPSVEVATIEAPTATKREFPYAMPLYVPVGMVRAVQVMPSVEVKHISVPTATKRELPYVIAWFIPAVSLSAKSVVADALPVTLPPAIKIRPSDRRVAV